MKTNTLMNSFIFNFATNILAGLALLPKAHA